MKRFFIMGTDTDCGKTYATCQLLNYLNENNKSCLGIKPIASGCEEVNGRLINADAELLAQHNLVTHSNINPWRFKHPVSPHLASHVADRSITAKDIADFCLSDDFPNMDYLLIEGAGGLMVPFNLKETWIDVLKATKIPVILIVGMKLGCLNHALLTEFALLSHNIPVAGFIVNCLDQEMMMLDENIKTLELMMKKPLIARIPYEGGVTPLKHGEILIGD